MNLSQIVSPDDWARRSPPSLTTPTCPHPHPCVPRTAVPVYNRETTSKGGVGDASVCVMSNSPGTRPGSRGHCSADPSGRWQSYELWCGTWMAVGRSERWPLPSRGHERRRGLLASSLQSSESSRLCRRSLTPGFCRQYPALRSRSPLDLVVSALPSEASSRWTSQWST